MPRSSAERQFTTNILTQAYRNLESIHPASHEPQAHLSFVGNEEVDYLSFRFVSNAETTYYDEEEAEQAFADLNEIASLAIDDTFQLLSDEWGISDVDLISGDDPERVLSVYGSQIEDSRYGIQLVEWDQINPASGETAHILYAAFQPEDVMQPIHTIIYVNGNVLDARKREQQTAAEEFEVLCTRHLEPHMSEEAYENLLDAIQHEISEIASSNEQNGALLTMCVQMALMDIEGLHPDAHHAVLTSLDAIVKELATIQDDISAGRDLLTPDDAFLIERIIKHIPSRSLAL